MKRQKIKNLLLLMFAITAVQSLHAQNVVTIEQAIEKAIKNSSAAGFSQAVFELTEAETKLSPALPGLGVTVEAGQINSPLFDSKLNITQTGYLPSYHRTFKKMQEGILKMGEAEKSLRDREIRQFVYALYIQYEYHQRLYDLYVKRDSVYAQALQRAGERLSAGASDDTEWIEMQVRLAHVKKMRMDSETELKALRSVFKIWISDRQEDEPAPISEQYAAVLALKNEEILAEHPLMMKMETALLQTDLEAAWKRAQKKPMWLLGLSNTSFRGTGADNKVYDASSRFTSFQMGMSIPVFGRQLNKSEEIIRLTKYKAGLEKEWTKIRLINQANACRQRLEETWNYYLDFQMNSVPLASRLLEIADSKLKNGEIDFMRYALLTEQAFTIIQDNAALKKQLDETVMAYRFNNI